MLGMEFFTLEIFYLIITEYLISYLMLLLCREQTPFNALDVSLPPSEEVQHLRRQVAKLNRRVMALELDTLHRQQRDKLVYIATIAYFILKAFSWITRN